MDTQYLICYYDYIEAKRKTFLEATYDAAISSVKDLEDTQYLPVAIYSISGNENIEVYRKEMSYV